MQFIFNNNPEEFPIPENFYLAILQNSIEDEIQKFHEIITEKLQILPEKDMKGHYETRYGTILAQKKPSYRKIFPRSIFAKNFVEFFTGIPLRKVREYDHNSVFNLAASYFVQSRANLYDYYPIICRSRCIRTGFSWSLSGIKYTIIFINFNINSAEYYSWLQEFWS